MRDVRSRFPDYDVLAKRNSPSWNSQTREAIDRRLADVPARRFCTDAEWITLQAVVARIMPQPPDRPPVPIAAMIDAELHDNMRDGYRVAGHLPMQEAWRRFLAAIEDEARLRFGAPFPDLLPGRQDDLLGMVQKGDTQAEAWGEMSPASFFKRHLLHQVVGIYYAHPTAWNEIGFGGPASPRGYVRLGFDRRDPWEAVERRDA